MSEQIKRARENIKLLEVADNLALSNLPSDILKPEYAKVLTEQEKQLHHYLLQYNDENYLPRGITKEYEFPEYFNYTSKSKKKGVIHRRARTDSNMFKRFMKNKAKLQMIKEQGLLKEEPKLQKIEANLLFNELEMPKFQNYIEHKYEPLEQIPIVPSEQFIPTKPILNFILPEPEKAPKDVKKDINNIEEIIKQLHSTGDTIPYYNPETIIGNIAEIAILKKHGGDCIVHNVMDAGIKKSELNIGITVQFPFKVENVNTTKLKDELLDCVSRNVQIIIIPFTLWLRGGGHSNILIYRVAENTIELFEPHGKYFNFNENDRKRINSAIEQIIKKINPAFKNKLRYLEPSTIFNEKGFQAIENEIKGSRIEGGGYCTLWSAFFMEMVFLNPKKTSKQIADEILTLSKNDSTYIKRIIRGYVIQTEKLLKETIKKVINYEYSYSSNRRMSSDKLYSKLTDWQQWVLNVATEGQKIVHKIDEPKIEHVELPDNLVIENYAYVEPTPAPAPKPKPKPEPKKKDFNPQDYYRTESKIVEIKRQINSGNYNYMIDQLKRQLKTFEGKLAKYKILLDEYNRNKDNEINAIISDTKNMTPSIQQSINNIIELKKQIEFFDKNIPIKYNEYKELEKLKKTKSVESAMRSSLGQYSHMERTRDEYIQKILDDEEYIAYLHRLELKKKNSGGAIRSKFKNCKCKGVKKCSC